MGRVSFRSPGIIALGLMLACNRPGSADDPSGICEGSPVGGQRPGDLADGECAVRVLSSAESCGQNCSVPLDVRIECNTQQGTIFDPTLGMSTDGPIAAFRSDGVVAGGTHLLRIARSDGEVADMSPLSTLGWRSLARVDDDGVVAFVAPDSEGSSGLVLSRVTAQGLSEEIIPDTQGAQDHGLWHGPDGVISLLSSTDDDDQALHRVRNTDGEWTVDPWTIPGWGPQFDYTADLQGAPHVWKGTSVSLRLHAQDALIEVAAVEGPPGWYDQFALLAPPRPAIPDSFEGRVAIMTHPEHLELLSVADGSVTSHPISTATPLLFDCADEPLEDDCSSTVCEERGFGIEGDLFGTAQTSDGRVWAVWVETTLEQSICYEFVDEVEPSGGGECRPRVAVDNSNAEIVVAEVDMTSGQVTERLSLPARRPFYSRDAGDYKTAWSLQLSSYDNQLGIAFTEDDGWPALRVVNVDVSTL